MFVPGSRNSHSIGMVALAGLLIVSTRLLVRAGKDQKSGTFTLTGSMNTARTRFSLLLLNTGEALAVGPTW